MGEAIFKHKLSHLEVAISSAGLGALVNYPADPMVQELLKLENIDCSEHRARQVNKIMVDEADLILVMEKNHRNEMIRLFPSSCGKVHLLGKWSEFEIADPYKKPKEIFQNAYRLIAQGVDEWQKRLWN